MPQIFYVLHFRGGASPSAADPQVIEVKTSALSGQFTTAITEAGLSSGKSVLDGEDALFESSVTALDANTFHEKGTITFGDGGHRLLFETVQPGTMSRAVLEGTVIGAVIWRVTQGEGQFSGATGYITSNFSMDQAGKVEDFQLAVLQLA